MATQAFTQLVRPGFSRFGFIWFGQAISFTLLAYLLAGPLADRVAEPFVWSPDGVFRAVELMVGSGPGRGMGLLLSFMGMIIVMAAMSGTLIPAIRNVEEG